MNPQQLNKCRAAFEAAVAEKYGQSYLEGVYIRSELDELWHFFQAAWSRPAPAYDPALTEPSGKMWSAGRAAFMKYAKQWDDCRTSEAVCVVADIAPTEIFKAMLAAAPMPPVAEAVPADPCPGCQVGGVCRTPKCGRLKSAELMALYGVVADTAPVAEAVQDECHHDDTRRLGAIWTKCDQCERMWADDDPKRPKSAAPSPANEGSEAAMLRKLAADLDRTADAEKIKSRDPVALENLLSCMAAHTRAIARLLEMTHQPQPSVQDILAQLRADRDRASGELRHAYNEACDRLDVLVSKIANASAAEGVGND